MRITRFAQSCILIETKQQRILIDPGHLLFDDSLLKEHWINIDVLLVTHKHGDHCHADSIKEILKNPQTKFYASQEVAEAYPELTLQIVKVGEVIDSGEIKIEVVKAVHGFIPPLKGGKEIFENIGYIIDDGDARAYLTSDTICFDHGYQADIVFIPICNHGLVMGPFEAGLFAQAAGAKLVIPVHYDNPKYSVDFKLAKQIFEKQGLNFKFLDLKQSIEF
ncbi:MBL fold metallo-hydrolase [Patescibacteria group bacterium]|nr:MBL fold metallo-hydrolase [Patescibacteria group bacterium]